MNLALTRGLALHRFHVEAKGAPVRHPLTGERTAKICTVTLFSFLAIRLAQDASKTGHVTGLMLLASEALVVVLTVLRRPAGTVDRSASARVVTTVSVFGSLLVRPASNAALVPDALTVLISGIGLTLVVLGKLSLGRSFGLAPANRGVVSTGLYRFVRHPIYMGYLITHVGFLIANPLQWNFGILATADIALVVRALREERMLAADPAYCNYTQRVRWRLVPGVF